VHFCGRLKDSASLAGSDRATSSGDRAIFIIGVFESVEKRIPVRSRTATIGPVCRLANESGIGYLMQTLHQLREFSGLSNHLRNELVELKTDLLTKSLGRNRLVFYLNEIAAALQDQVGLLPDSNMDCRFGLASKQCSQSGQPFRRSVKLVQRAGIVPWSAIRLDIEATHVRATTAIST